MSNAEHRSSHQRPFQSTVADSLASLQVLERLTCQSNVTEKKHKTYPVFPQVCLKFAAQPAESVCKLCRIRMELVASLTNS